MPVNSLVARMLEGMSLRASAADFGVVEEWRALEA